jgi:xylitol oxidase
MNKREFLKASSAMLTTSILSRYASGADQTTGAQRPAGEQAAHLPHRTNWAGNFTYSTDRLYSPTTVEEVQHIVKNAPSLRGLGARHSFNSIADSIAAQISLKGFDSMELDRNARTVTVGAGVTYGKLAPYIDAQGFAVHNLASLPHISVVGACATATHGSGVRNGNLSTSIVAIELVKADGTVVTLSRASLGDKFNGVAVAMGALGITIRITLQVEPTFQATQSVYQNLSFNELKNNLDTIMSSGYSVSLFTDWQNHKATQVWIKRRVQPGVTHVAAPMFYGATLATKKLHPLEGHDAENCTEQMGIPGPWYERLPHFRMNFTPSSGQELQTEYLIPREHAYEAILAVEQLRDRITPHLFITELRTIAADDLWVSTAYKQPSLAIHFTWKPEWPAVKAILPLIEAKLAPFHARPHWGKLFTMDPAHIQSLYPRMEDFKRLVQEYDPHGKFSNAFLQTNLSIASVVA